MINNIKDYRKAYNMNQTELANYVSVSRITISNIERGVHIPNYELVEKLCDVFMVEPRELFPKNNIKCLTCKHCNEGVIVDETIAMFKCDVYGLKVIGVFGCNDYEKRTRDKITQSKENRNGTK